MRSCGEGELMRREYFYIDDPNIFAIYIHSLQLLIITTNIDGQHGVIYIN